MQHWVGALVCAPPAPDFTLVTGGAGGLQLHGPAWLFPLIRTTRKSSVFSLLGLFARVSSLSLSLDDLACPASVWRSCGWAFHRVSDAAGDSGALLGLPFLQCTVQPVPLCSPWAIVWQPPSVNLPSRSPERKWRSASVWPYISPGPWDKGLSLLPSPDVAQHGHTITSYSLSSQA